MAETDIEDIAADAAAAEAPAAGGGLVRKLMLGGAALVLLGLGIVAGPAVRGLLGADPADDGAAPAAEPPAARKATPAGPELYTGLHPAMVVNFRDAIGETHFMQIEMEVMARDQAVINAVRAHTPLIRNNLILLYGNVEYEAVTTRAGKEKMLADGLREIQDILGSRVGKPNVEALYFTSLIIQ